MIYLDMCRRQVSPVGLLEAESIDFEEKLRCLTIEISKQNEFHDVQASVAGFSLRYPGMKHAKPLGHVSLGETCLFSCAD